MAIIPGFPWWVFIIIGSGAIITGLAISHTDQFREFIKLPSIPRTNIANEEANNYLDRFKTTEPISLNLSSDLYDQIDLLNLQNAINKIRGTIIDTLGVPIPSVRVISLDSKISQSFKVSIFDVRAADEIIDRSNANEPNDVEQITNKVERIIYSNAHQFIGVQETATLMQKIAQTNPDLIKELARLLPTQTIAQILKNLIEERVPIRNLKNIFETLIETGTKEKDSLTLLEYVRISLKDHTLSKFLDEKNNLIAWVLSSELEATLRKKIVNTPLGNNLAIDKNLSESILKQISQCRSGELNFEKTNVFITTIDLRRHLRTLIKTVHPDLSVLSYHELDPGINLSVSGVINA
jgi:type III secretion protein V